MGDVVHAVPVVEDIKRFISDAEIDWLVEDSFADIPRHVAGVAEVIECSVRKWKKRIFEKSTRDQIKALREKLRGKHYDLVIDLQGLIKSAVLASWTNAPVAGYDRRSGKEPLATILYSVKSSVDRQKSAVDRCRELAAKSLGYDLGSTKPQFNFQFEGSPESAGSVFFFCNTSRETKLWPEEKWIELGGELIRRGKKVVLPWGSPEEKERVLRIQARLGAAAEVPERMPIGQLMEKISSADAVIGLDTGMTHLSAAMGRPTVGIFRDYPIELVPLVGEGKKKALGGVGCCPQVQEVLSAYEKVIERFFPVRFTVVCFTPRCRQPCYIYISVRENSRSTWSIGPSDSGRLTIRRELKEEPGFGYMRFPSERPEPHFLWSSRSLNAGPTPKFFIRI